MTILSVLLICGLLCGLAAYFLLLHRYKGREVVNEWNEDDEFRIDEIRTVEKKPGKDFVILNLADVQMCDLEDLFHMKMIEEEITALIEETKPDLITLTGDQTWSNENLIVLTSLVRFLDSFGIPYAPVFGNHDYGNGDETAVLDRNACCDIYERGSYSLFSRGPSDLDSLGNYLLNITENGKILRTIYMLDAGYGDEITDRQIAWMRWNAEGICAANGGRFPESITFFHKPIPEFTGAYFAFCRGDADALGDVEVHYSLSGTLQNGFFEAAKEINVTDIVCGHQHGNSFTILYRDVRLTSALKTGELGGYYEDEDVYLNGATVIRIGEQTQISTVTVDRERFHIEP